MVMLVNIFRPHNAITAAFPASVSVFPANGDVHIMIRFHLDYSHRHGLLGLGSFTLTEAVDLISEAGANVFETGCRGEQFWSRNKPGSKNFLYVFGFMTTVGGEGGVSTHLLVF